MSQSLQDQISTLTAELKHWKGNHADIVKRKALLEQRPDLPVDRLPAYREMKRLQAENAVLKTSPQVPEGWKLVPIDPTEDMIVDGFESRPDEHFSPSEVWEEYAAMSGCQQAAHCAKLCYAAMLKAAPLPAVAPTPAFPPRNESKPAEQQGLFNKFTVTRTDGSDAPGGKHHGCRHFVLDLSHDQHAAAAMRTYAAACRATHPLLADDIEREFGVAPTPGNASDSLPCPFCGGTVDPSGWLGCAAQGEDMREGPECEECGATASSMEDWNKRAAPVAAQGDAGDVECSELQAALFCCYMNNQFKNDPKPERAPCSGDCVCWEDQMVAKHWLTWVAAVNGNKKDSAGPIAPDLAGERERFEQYMSDDGKWLQIAERDENGNEIFSIPAIAWQIWQAALASRPQVSALGEKSCLACDGKGGWVTAEWIDPVSGPECEGERCEECEGTGKVAELEQVSAAGVKNAMPPHDSFLSEHDMADLLIFSEQVEDSDADGYTVSKESMKRLAELGAVNSRGFGRYEMTAFGSWLIEGPFLQYSGLPLSTAADFNARSAAMAKGVQS